MSWNVVDLSSYAIDDGDPDLRIAHRHKRQRTDMFEDRYDYFTIFFDVYRSVTGDVRILMPGPDNVSRLVAQASFEDVETGRALVPEIVEGDRLITLTFADSAGVSGVRVRSARGEAYLGVQPSMARLFEDRNVMLVLNRNNRLHLIAQWAAHYAQFHGANGFLFYDNASDLYGRDDLMSAVRAAVPDAAVAVVPWPFLFGASYQGQTSGALDRFCQFAMLEHAKHRCVTRARGVGHLDIDELVHSHDGSALFAQLACEDSGLITMRGRTMSAASPSGASDLTASYTDFPLMRPRRRHDDLTKWALRPADWQHKQWQTHTVLGERPEPSENFLYFHYRHLRDASVSPKIDIVAGVLDPKKARKFWGRSKNDEPAAIAERYAQFPQVEEARTAPVVARTVEFLRREAGRLYRQTRYAEALEVMGEALAQDPDNPGFLEFVARLEMALGRESEANAAYERAQAIRAGYEEDAGEARAAGGAGAT